MKRIFLFLLTTCYWFQSNAENGYDLWLRYMQVGEPTLSNYRTYIKQVHIEGNSPTIEIIRQELATGLKGLLGKTIPFSTNPPTDGAIILKLNSRFQVYPAIGNEGYRIYNNNQAGKKSIVINANTEHGLLYGVFHFLRLLQMHQSLKLLSVESSPRISLRMLNHWDNLDRSVERGYAGFSLWNWHTLPDYTDQRYKDYARANASIGINATVLTNVNANAAILTNTYLEKVAALANVFRPYGIKVFLTARFSAPIEAGGLSTADPLHPDVIAWWRNKVNEIYKFIPDFGGFLVKANSEGQPGPQNYGRTHADGANMLAAALAPHNGIVIWRAFVYTNENPEDRHKQAYNEFAPLDGKFNSNVVIQVKNGAIDFMPREPFHPLFGAMPSTTLAMEFQITQEYLGQSTHLVYLAPLFTECLQSDTYRKGKGTTVARIIDGTSDKHALSVIAGVANTGNDLNWTGHLFAQANWYAFGRLSWDHQLSPQSIADEWLRMTFNSNNSFIATAKKIMMESRENTVQYMNPIGLHHLMGTGHHYGPAPWVNELSRADWNPVYYHKADSAGIGFDRTSTGSNALAQYAPEIQTAWQNPDKIPLQYLLWFHHVPFDKVLITGNMLWEELCSQYNTGVKNVRRMQSEWKAIEGLIDNERFTQVDMMLSRQEKEAVWWRDACLIYFKQFSKKEIPSRFEQPAHTLQYYQSLRFPYAPGN